MNKANIIRFYKNSREFKRFEEFSRRVQEEFKKFQMISRERESSKDIKNAKRYYKRFKII
jgi:hypothetical protein